MSQKALFKDIILMFNDKYFTPIYENKGNAIFRKSSSIFLVTMTTDHDRYPKSKAIIVRHLIHHFKMLFITTVSLRVKMLIRLVVFSKYSKRNTQINV